MRFLKGRLPFLLLYILPLLASSVHAQWEMIGPDGAPDDIVQVGSDLYAATKYGFYRTSDDGRTWKRIEKGVQKRYRHHFDIRYDGYELCMPARPFSEGGRDRGFYVFDTDAEEWKYQDSTHDKLYTEGSKQISPDSFLCIIPNPLLSDTSAFDTVDALYLTTDKGTTWIKRSPGDSVIAKYFQYIDGQIFVAAFKEKTPHLLLVFYSNDYGITWKKTEYPGAGYYNFFGPFPGYLIGKFSSNPFFYRSTNGGVTWVEQTQGISGSLIAGVLIDTFELLVCSGSPMLITNNKGKNWEMFTTASGEYIYRFCKRSTGDGYIALVSKSKNSGWQLCQLDRSLQIVRFAENAGFVTTAQWLVHATDSLLAVVGSSNLDPSTTAIDSILISTDRGDSWLTRNVTAPGLGLHFTPWVQGKDYVYALGVADTGQHNIIRSSDQGLHWEDVSPDTPINSLPLVLAATNDTLAVHYTIAGVHRYRMSTDAGATWRVVQPIFPAIIGACFLNGAFYTMQNTTTGEGFYRTTNGLVWESIVLPSGNAMEFSGNVFSLDGVLFISARSGKKGEYSYFLFRSTDAGSTWTDVNDQIGLFGWNLHLVHRGSTMYLLSMGDFFPGPPGGHPKLYSSSDRGATWLPLDNRIPEGEVLAATGKDLFASSWEGGVYRLKNASGKVRDRTTATSTVSVFPNPATSTLTITHKARERGLYTYTIIGLLGDQLFSTSTYSESSGSLTLELPLSGLSSGTHTLLITSSASIERALFTVIR